MSVAKIESISSRHRVILYLYNILLPLCSVFVIALSYTDASIIDEKFGRSSYHAGNVPVQSTIRVNKLKCFARIKSNASQLTVLKKKTTWEHKWRMYSWSLLCFEAFSPAILQFSFYHKNQHLERI